AKAIMRMVFGLRSTSARVVTISHTYRPAPCSRQSWRNATLVMPAIGASTTGGSTTYRPSTSPATSSRIPHRSNRAETLTVHARESAPPESYTRDFLRLLCVQSRARLLRTDVAYRPLPKREYLWVLEALRFVSRGRQ